MKRLRQLCAATVLTILLTNAASADDGVMHPGYVPPPPPVATSGIMHPGFAATGEPEIRNEEPATDLATEITLLLVRNVIALF